MSDRQKTRARPNPRRAFAETYGAVLANGIERRGVLKGFLALAAGAVAMPHFGRVASATEVSTLTFAELTRVRDREDHWPAGYSRQTLARWGDGLFADSPAFDPAKLDGKVAERQFGYNNDFTFFMPLPHGSTSSERGLIPVRHEYATPFLMFPGLTADDYREKLTDNQIRAVMASVCLSVFDVKKTNGQWEIVRDGQYNRRIHMGTEMAISGPASADEALLCGAYRFGMLFADLHTGRHDGVHFDPASRRTALRGR